MSLLKVLKSESSGFHSAITSFDAIITFGMNFALLLSCPSLHHQISNKTNWYRSQVPAQHSAKHIITQPGLPALVKYDAVLSTSRDGTGGDDKVVCAVK